MLKLLFKSAVPCRVSRVLRFSTTKIQTTSSSFKPKGDTLYARLLPAWHPSVSCIPILDQWVTEGKPIDQSDLRRIIKQLRNSKLYQNALQISEWMGDMKVVDFAPGDLAVQLHLISKVRGVEEAEKYFDGIPESLRVYPVYGALLKCYAESKNLAKAEAIMQKLRVMGYLGILGYNIMLTLYSQTENYDKFNSLIREMQEKGIECDSFSYNVQLNTYVTSSDIEGMENLLMKMEVDPLIKIDWHAYATAAEGYAKAGDTEKATAVLKKSERLVRGQKVETAYQFLLTKYARIGKKHDIYRIWDLVKKFGKFRNKSYLCMISSLQKVDDLEGAEKILEEWEANKMSFDIRVPNLLVTAYCEKGHFEKVELLIKRLIDSGYKPEASTWSRVARGYLMYNDKEKAVEMMKKAILEMNSMAKNIDFFTLASCLEYLKEKGDPDRAEELVQLMEERSQSPVDVRCRIMEYISRDKLQPKVETLKEDIVEQCKNEESCRATLLQEKLIYFL